ncbi:MAG TPA: SUMF1/EgtB/PvdO family nonheme iron enzyme [Chloroflexota bacterium]|nr:SUMF1/EgtB/PvdO family nonheme iron enzyme [Chloroflexota bacterium]
MNQSEILRFLQERVSEDELKTICFHLQVDYESLPAVGKGGKALELIKFMQRRGRLPELEAAASRFGAVGEGTPDSVKPYLKVLAQRTNALPLAPLDPKGRDAAAISLEQVFINLDAGTATHKSAHAEDEKVTIHQRYQAALAHIHHRPRLILLGDPGSGKSTLLRFLTHCLAQHALAPDKGWLNLLRWSQEKTLTFVVGDLSPSDGDKSPTTNKEEQHWAIGGLLPVLVELRDFAATPFAPHSAVAIWQYIENRLRDQGFGEAIPALHNLARQGRLLLLLDGVDEVPLEQRPAVWQAINALNDGPYLDNRWVATCRILSFAAAEAPKGVPVQTLQPLNEQQIDRFISSWYGVLAETGELGAAQAKQMARQLQTAAHRRRLQPLAENPMLLTIMALVQTYHGTLPDERARLYQACVETLLLRWQRHKEMGPGAEMPDFLAQLGVNQQQLERLLWEIAWRAHSRAAERQESADIAETEVMGIAKNHLGSYQKAEQFIEYTERRAHLLVGHGGQQQRVYRFPHRTFQEYLAACYVASQRDFSRGAPKLAQRGDSWREVLNLAAGTLVFNQNNVEKALDGIREVLPERAPAANDVGGWYRVWLAAEMMLVVGKEVAQRDDVGRKVLPQLQKLLVALLAAGVLTPPQRAEAGDALGLLGDPRPGVCTLEPEMIPIPAGPFLMGDYKVTVRVDTYAIARYPVTNAQYRFFIEAGGYENPDFWTKEGWQQRGQDKWTQPRYWDDPFISIDNKPAVGVSWYEAVAYCNWLSAKTGKSYRLPTEAEWERAARHTDARTYPWGGTWPDGIINSIEAGVGRTMAVGSFPHSTAVCGAQDMSGNIWEWCHTRYWDEKEKVYPLPYREDDGRENLGSRSWRVVRGGSWNDLRGHARTAYRNHDRPSERDDGNGFRLVVRRSPSYPDH